INTISGAIIRAQNTLASSGALVVKKYSGTATGNILIVDTAGLVYDATNKRVGVGTAAPSTKFQVYDSINTDVMLIMGRNNPNNLILDQENNPNAVYSNSANILFKVRDTSSTAFDGAKIQGVYSALKNGAPEMDLRFMTRDETSLATRMTITATGSVGIGTTAPKATLDILGTASGTDLYAARSISGSHLYAARTFGGAGLADCDAAGTSKLLWDSTTKRFSCGTDSNTGTFGTGNVLTIGDARYVRKAGDTMTGVLVIQNGNTHTATTTPLLNVRGAMSGRSLYISGSGGSTSPLISAISEKGKVGIGTLNPTSTLTVHGTFGINLINSGTDFLTVDNTDNGRLVLDASDPHGQQIIFTPRSSATGRGTAVGLTDFSAALNIVNGINLGSTLTSFDVGISRSAAGILKVNDGSTGLAALHASLLSGSNLTVSRS
ncbi:MAG: hypothetical protein ABL879_19500, partial [Devosia sp.]